MEHPRASLLPARPWLCVGCGRARPPEISARWFVVRHGETDWNRDDRYMGHAPIPLNATGRGQVKTAGILLRNRAVHLIISSDICRCKETAELVARELGVGIVFDARLRERNMGDWQGLTRQEVKKRYRGRGIDRFSPAYRMPGGESLEDLERRVDAAIAGYRDSYQSRNLVIVTHAGPMIRIRKSLQVVTETRADDFDPPTAAILEVAFSATPCGCGRDVMAERAGSR